MCNGKQQIMKNNGTTTPLVIGCIEFNHSNGGMTSRMEKSSESCVSWEQWTFNKYASQVIYHPIRDINLSRKLLDNS